MKETDNALKQAKGQLKTEKFKNSAADVGSTIIEGIGSVIGTSKVKRQQQEIETLKADKNNLIQEISILNKNIQATQTEYEATINKLKQELKKIHDLFPNIKELLWIEGLLKVLKFSESLIKDILKMKPVRFKGKIYSPEYKQHFDTEHSVAEIKPHPKESNKLQLTIDGVSDAIWFKHKYREFQEAIGINVKSKQAKEFRL